MSLIIPANSAAASGGYAVDNSARFNNGSSDYLNNTSVSTVTNRLKFTISFWVKRSTLGAKSMIGTVGGDTDNFGAIWFDSSDRLNCTEGSGGGTLNFITNRLFRDLSAWYNIILAIDTTQGTESNRVKIYVNGVQETSFSTSTYPGQNSNMHLNRGGKTQYIGRHTDSSNNYYFDGYMSEVVWIDGSQEAVTSFGEFDEDSGIWKPIDVSGLTFGNNGFYLDFENSGALGADVSGNSNNFTVNNLTAIDQTTDTPTNNFATFNPLINTQNIPTFAEGNTQVTTTNGGVNGGYSTLGISSGKWFAEFKLTAFNTNRAVVGIVDNPSELDRTNTVIGESAYSVSYLGNGGNIVNNSSIVGSGSSYTTNDIIGVALNLDDNNILFYKNGAVQNSGTAVSITAASSTPTGFYFFAAADASTNYYATIQANFGNPAFTGTDKTDGNSRGSFEYEPPSGYLSLCTANLSEVLG